MEIYSFVKKSVNIIIQNLDELRSSFKLNNIRLVILYLKTGRNR